MDNGDATYQTMNGRAMNLYVKLSTLCSFADPEILSIPADKLADMMQDPSLKTYRHMLEDTDRMRAHTLDGKTEEMLAMLAQVTGSNSESFDMLSEVDMTFPEIKGEDGEMTTLTHGNFGVFRESRDRRVRQESFETYFGV